MNKGSKNSKTGLKVRIQPNPPVPMDAEQLIYFGLLCTSGDGKALRQAAISLSRPVPPGVGLATIPEEVAAMFREVATLVIKKCGLTV